ncbi:MAG: hypothetical protein ACRESZ_15190 [Methylococcales bacterium]
MRQILHGTATTTHATRAKIYPISKMFQPGRHTGRDCRYPEHMDVFDACHPWLPGSGNPCRNDAFWTS